MVAVSAKGRAMSDFSNWDILRNLLLAARWTVLLSLVAFVCGGIVGLIVLMLRTGRSKLLRRLAAGYIEIFQGTPLLMQLFLAFFGLALFGLDVPAWLAAGLALTLWTGAFLAEIWRGCVESIAKGQWEASSSLAMGYLQQMRYVILPQALRVAIPPTVGFSVQVVKGTAVTSIIGFVELSKASTMITNATFRPFVVYAFVALIYFALCWPLSKTSQALERKLNVAHRGH
jgi:polar amino acid transport system permease protein